MRKAVLIVAGGSGLRMGKDIPKQFLMLNGFPVLMHTIKRFYEFDAGIKIIVALPAGEMNRWQNLITENNFKIEHSLVEGGLTRIQSVKNGLQNIPDDCLVAIHDGVRPLCTPNLIARCFDAALKNNNAIPAISLYDTIREVSSGKTTTVDREKLRSIQTPQCFSSALIKKAYANLTTENVTDDAGVYENSGNKINLIEGEKANIKITDPTDLLIASALEKELFGK